MANMDFSKTSYPSLILAVSKIDLVDKGIAMDVVYLGFSKAFDKARHYSLLTKL